MATKTTFDVTKHVLVPKHEVCSEAEKTRLFAAYNLSLENMPRILASDAGIEHLNVKGGDIIKISRASYTAGDTVFYRKVVGE